MNENLWMQGIVVVGDVFHWERDALGHLVIEPNDKTASMLGGG